MEPNLLHRTRPEARLMTPTAPHRDLPRRRRDLRLSHLRVWARQQAQALDRWANAPPCRGSTC